MDIQAQIFNTIIPLTGCVLAMLPFIFFPNLRQKDDDIKMLTYRVMLGYLMCLGFTILALIIIQATVIMTSHSSARALFICAILLVACLDKAVDLLPQMMFIKTTLLKRLLCFVVILCSIPIIWQVLMSTIPQDISNNPKFTGATEIALMLIILTLSIIRRPNNKESLEQNS